MRLALLPLLLIAPVTYALDPSWSITQYGHTMWTLHAGVLPGTPTDMAQTTDGYLWVGTRGGLVRFDGVRFVPFTPPKAEELLTPRIMSLRAASDGSLWIGTRADLEHWQNGHLTHYPDAGGSITGKGVGDDGFDVFQCIAAAADGTVWVGASLCIAAGIGVLWLLYLIRVKQVETRIRVRLEERVIERERIARDLHDTFLQSVQGLVLRFQAVLACIPEGGERPVRMMEQALERADQVIAESRDRVYDLRKSTHASSDLPQALQALAQELAQTVDGTGFRVTVEGTPRALHPLVREETYRIGAEALTNAVRHAVATRVDIEITYSRKDLTLRVVDNGRGFDAAVLSEGAPRGHFGLTGMRERARRIRARFEVSTRTGSGSAVEVRVPASIAYRSEQRLEARTG